jgi:hypothetical protein
MAVAVIAGVFFQQFLGNRHTSKNNIFSNRQALFLKTGLFLDQVYQI